MSVGDDVTWMSEGCIQTVSGAHAVCAWPGLDSRALMVEWARQLIVVSAHGDGGHAEVCPTCGTSLRSCWTCP
eukprot:36058-Eustigmatos_ZCMA.PRE.1